MKVDLDKLALEAERGSVVALTIVGSHLLDGVDIETNHVRAFDMLSQAARAGAPHAMFHLARMYADGLAVSADPVKAHELFEAASEKGEFLAHIYLARINLLTDPEKAAQYYQRAASLEDVLLASDEMREAIDFLNSDLNPQKGT